MSPRLLIAASTCLVLAVTTLEASECILMDARTMKKEAGLVIDGTISNVRELENDAADVADVTELTIDVHRVWKGDAGTQVTVHYREEPRFAYNPPSPRVPTRFKPGQRFVVFATERTFRGQPKLAQDQRILWVPRCSGLHLPDPDLIRQLGRSRKPKGTEPNFTLTHYPPGGVPRQAQ